MISVYGQTMKKKPENSSSIEPCYRMSNLKTGIIDNNIKLEEFDNADEGLHPNSSNSDGIPHIKPEQDSLSNHGSPDANDQCRLDGVASPSASPLGPGAEIKGKLCHPIPSVSKIELDPSSSPDDESSPPPPGICGGRLTFFREGRPLLELSHRSDQRSWIQVKSKTYWPPPSHTTATSTQHPLRHDTPTTHSASDDCSSLNSSPWSSDHIRKQSTPRTKISISLDLLFYYKASSFTRDIRKKVRLRRNPHIPIIGPCFKNSDALNFSKVYKSTRKVVKFPASSKNRLESKIKGIWEKYGCKFEKFNIHSLFEKSLNNHIEVPDLTFLSPRKRYLRTMESDGDSHIRKKVHAGLNASHIKNCDRPSSSSPSLHPHKSAISSHSSSSYSIDSLLNSENDSRKSESYLRNLLKPESKLRVSRPKSRDRNSDSNDKIRLEKECLSYPRERKEPIMDHRKTLPEHFDLNHHDLSRYTPSPGLGNLYLNPYLDPRFMMLHNLSAGSPLMPPSSQPNEVSMAATAAAVAAAAASYPLNPLHLSAFTASSLIPPVLHSPYPSTMPPLASHLLQSPSSNRSSPVSLSHSPISKPSVVPSPAPVSPHLRIYGSPVDHTWNPLVNSPHKIPHEPPDSPPPQDVPLNLTKPKDNS